MKSHQRHYLRPETGDRSRGKPRQRADYTTSMTEGKNLLFGFFFFLVSEVQEGIKQPTVVLNMRRDFESKIMGCIHQEETTE